MHYSYLTIKLYVYKFISDELLKYFTLFLKYNLL